MSLAWSKLLQHSATTIAVIAASIGGAAAQAPERAITMVVPVTPGTGPDLLARTIAEELQRRWNQPVVIENKTGASTIVGTQFVARAAPDGHTLLKRGDGYEFHPAYWQPVL